MNYLIDKHVNELNEEELKQFLNGDTCILVDNYSIIQTKDDNGNIIKTYIGLKGLERKINN